MQVTINLNKMQFYAYHGVLPQEREVGGVFEVSLKLSVSNVEKAVLFDRLEETINYAEVYELTKSVMRKPTLLLEHLAWSIIDCLFATYDKIIEINIEVVKVTPPICGFEGNVSVSISSTRSSWAG